MQIYVPFLFSILTIIVKYRGYSGWTNASINATCSEAVSSAMPLLLSVGVWPGCRQLSGQLTITTPALASSVSIILQGKIWSLFHLTPIIPDQMLSTKCKTAAQRHTNLCSQLCLEVFNPCFTILWILACNSFDVRRRSHGGWREGGARNDGCLGSASSVGHFTTPSSG